MKTGNLLNRLEDAVHDTVFIMMMYTTWCIFDLLNSPICGYERFETLYASLK